MKQEPDRDPEDRREDERDQDLVDDAVDVDRLRALATISTAPSRPPIRAWLDELGMPSRHVIRFQMIAPTSAAATIDLARRPVGRRRQPGRDRLRDRGPGQRADEVGRRRHEDRVLGPERPGRHRRRDRVGGVVEAVDVVEDDGQDEDDEQERAVTPFGHGAKASSRRAVRPRAGADGRRRAGYPSPMRLSHLFFTTLRDDPADAEMASHRLLLRAGYVRQLGSGIYSLLPLGKRVNDRVEQIIREEQDRIGGQEMEMPVVHPADVWRASGRYDAIGPELVRFKDRGGRDMVLAMTHEEVVGILLADIVEVYRQLPMMVYHFQTKLRDEPRVARRADPRPRVRDEGRLQLRPRRGRARRELPGPVRGLRADLRAARARRDRGQQPTSGSWAAAGAHEFMVLNPAGEDVLVLCEACGYAANRQIAEHPQARRPRAEDAAAARGGRDARHDDDRDARGVPRDRPERGPPRPPSS